jgi:hypothetical protein
MKLGCLSITLPFMILLFAYFGGNCIVFLFVILVSWWSSFQLIILFIFLFLFLQYKQSIGMLFFPEHLGLYSCTLFGYFGLAIFKLLLLSQNIPSFHV